MPIAESDEVEYEPDGKPNEHIIFNLHVCFSSIVLFYSSCWLQVTCKKNKSVKADETDDHIRFINHYATSGQLEWQPIGDQAKWLSDVRIVNDDILIAKLRPGQEIEARLVTRELSSNF